VDKGETQDEKFSLVAELKALRTEVTELKGLVHQPRRSFDQASGESQVMYRGRGCPACKKTGTGLQCRHCWKCGDPTHIKSKCPRLGEPNQNPGN
jgi:hypothetical protein